MAIVQWWFLQEPRRPFPINQFYVPHNSELRQGFEMDLHWMNGEPKFEGTARTTFQRGRALNGETSAERNVRFEIVWDDGKIGEYDGRLDDDGRMRGTTHRVDDDALHNPDPHLGGLWTDVYFQWWSGDDYYWYGPGGVHPPVPDHELPH